MMHATVAKPRAPRPRALVWELVERLDEQRRLPRIPVSAPAGVARAGHAAVPMVLVNVSPDGLQLRSDANAAQAVHTGGRIVAGQGPVVRVQTSLVVGGTRRAFDASCRLLYLTLVDRAPRCVLGLRFTALDSGARVTLDAFLADQLA